MRSDLPVALPLPVPPASRAVVRIRKARTGLLLLAPGLHPLLLKLPLLPNMLGWEPWPWPVRLSLLSSCCRPKKKNVINLLLRTDILDSTLVSLGTNTGNAYLEAWCNEYEPQQPTSFTPSAPLIRTDSFVDAFTPVQNLRKRRVARKHTEEELAEIKHAATRRAHEQVQAKEREADQKVRPWLYPSGRLPTSTDIQTPAYGLLLLMNSRLAFKLLTCHFLYPRINIVLIFLCLTSHDYTSNYGEL